MEFVSTGRRVIHAWQTRRLTAMTASANATIASSTTKQPTHARHAIPLVAPASAQDRLLVSLVTMTYTYRQTPSTVGIHVRRGMMRIQMEHVRITVRQRVDVLSSMG